MHELKHKFTCKETVHYYSYKRSKKGIWFKPCAQNVRMNIVFLGKHKGDNSLRKSRLEIQRISSKYILKKKEKQTRKVK